jgi:nitrogen fixation-related uncharacterized protein
MAASVSAVCGIFTSAITAVAIVIVILAIAGMIFVSWGLDNDLFEKEDVTNWLEIIFRRKEKKNKEKW